MCLGGGSVRGSQAQHGVDGVQLSLHGSLRCGGFLQKSTKSPARKWWGGGEGWTGLVRIILKEKIAPKPSVTETKVIQFICWVVKVCVEKGLQQERPVKIDMANMPYMYTVRVCTWHLSAQASRSSGGDSSGRLLPISSNILLQLL